MTDASQKPVQTLDQAFARECDLLLKTFLKKHKDYGKGNILEIGDMGIAFRLTEKVSRLKNLLSQGKTPVNESIDDNLTDISVYGILAKLYRSGEFEKLNVDESVLAAVE
jgi:hypothetical protein